MTRAKLERQRTEILKRMERIRTMRRGTVSEQFLKVSQKGQAEPVERGPYYLWQYWEQGKPLRKRLRSAAEVAAAQKEVAAHKEFEELCARYVRVAEQLGELEREAAASHEAVKKGLKSRSSKARKSTG
jgi:hypothetical protein